MESTACSGVVVAAGLAVASMLMGTGCGGGVDPSNPGTATPNEGLAMQAGTVSIRGLAHGSDGTPLPGVNVCLGGLWWANTPSDECVTSDANGSFLLPGAPAEQSTSIWFQKSGFLPALRAIQTQAADIILPAQENLLFSAEASGMLMGVKLDPTKGHIAFHLSGAGQGQAPSMSVTTKAADGSVLSPVYIDASGDPTPGTSTGSRGGFMNLDPGLYVLQFEGSPLSCSADGLSGYPVSTPSSVLVPVVAGAMTAPVAVTCTGP